MSFNQKLNSLSTRRMEILGLSNELVLWQNRWIFTNSINSKNSTKLKSSDYHPVSSSFIRVFGPMIGLRSPAIVYHRRMGIKKRGGRVSMISCMIHPSNRPMKALYSHGIPFSFSSRGPIACWSERSSRLNRCTDWIPRPIDVRTSKNHFLKIMIQNSE